MNGLFLTVPLMFLRTRDTLPPPTKGFDVWPTLDDGLTALGFCGFAFCLTSAILAAMAGGGRRLPSHCDCDTANHPMLSSHYSPGGVPHSRLWLSSCYQ